MADQHEHAGLSCSNANEGHAAHPFCPFCGMEDEAALKSCTLCDNPDANMHCPICGTRYCNRQCYTKDWPHHKSLCKAARDEFNVNKAPLNSVRAILFPEHSKKPTWTWIHLKTLDISIIRALGINMKSPFKKSYNKLFVEDINQTLVHRKIGHGIRQFHAQDSRVGGVGGVNKSIFALGDPGSLGAYFGSAICLCYRTIYEPQGVKVCYENASPRDLRMIIEWVYTRPDNPFVSKLYRLPLKFYCQPREEVSLWPAVKILCDGDKTRLRALSGSLPDKFQNVQVLSKAVGQIRCPCVLAELARLPWVIQPCLTMLDPITEGDKPDLLKNWHGRTLAQDSMESFKCWTFDYSNWNPGYLKSTYCGSILIMHERGCMIDKLHVDCFTQYADLVLNMATSMFKKDNGEGTARIVTRSEDLWSVLTKQGFEEFWAGYISAKLGKLASAFPSPYNDTYAGEKDPVPVPEEETREAREQMESLLLEGA
ncbi:hypothetical protein F4678DRAFT_484857 [Xylaria arbuscula]|nr:hypothetical protein F4678DRAFT_484857 [Xylaria arbuscula]